MTTPTVWELINPSDAYTLECDDHAVAAVAVLLLGVGNYALREAGGERHVPIMLFGPNDAWAQETFGCSVGVLIGDTLATKHEAVCAALDSVLIASAADRASYRKAMELIDDPDKRLQYRIFWNDLRKSSLNDIGGRAWAMADKMRANAAYEKAAEVPT